MKTIAQIIHQTKFPLIIRQTKFPLIIRDSYYEDSGGRWAKAQFDSNNIRIYFENSDGVVEDNRE